MGRWLDLLADAKKNLEEAPSPTDKTAETGVLSVLAAAGTPSSQNSFCEAAKKNRLGTGVDAAIIYDPNVFIAKSIHEVVVTIFVAILLVVGVVFLFLQNWRATIIPVMAIPVSLVGTFTILAAFGISLNNLSLFGLVLAVGIVVDDAIVVVENVERNMRD